MDYFKGLSTSGIFGDKSSKIKTWSLSKVEYAYDEKYCLHKFYFKYGNIYLRQPTYDEVRKKKNAYLLLNGCTIYRKKDTNVYEYFDDESKQWLIDGDIDDEEIQNIVDNEAVLKIKA